MQPNSSDLDTVVAGAKLMNGLRVAAMTQKLILLRHALGPGHHGIQVCTIWLHLVAFDFERFS